MKNISNEEVKYNSIYFTTLEELQPFHRNSEISEIKLWDLNEKVGYIDEVDIKTFEYVKLRFVVF